MRFPTILANVALLGSVLGTSATEDLPPAPSHSGPSIHDPPTTHSTLSHAVRAPAPLPTKYVHFACGTDASTASPHFLSTITKMHLTSPTNITSRDELDEPPIEDIGGGSPAARAALEARTTSPKITVNTYVHIVTTKAHQGMVTQSQIQKQVAMMNSAYNTHDIYFTLRKSDFTTNDKWAAGATDSDDMAMKKALRQGSYSSLNLYFQSDLAGGVLGKCTLPTDVGKSPAKSAYAVDGCNIAAGTVPGGNIYGYNMGKTAVHETGHWLGLLHTFEGYSCSGNGDFVADTAQEAQSTDGCPTNPWKNTCGIVRPGYDPIHNYMDYSTDACYERFSPGQEARMRGLWPTYRLGK